MEQWKFKRGRFFLAPKSLVESWWQVLEDAGFPVDLKQPPERYQDDTIAGRYFRGESRLAAGSITVIAMPCPPAYCQPAHIGHEVLFLGYSTPSDGRTMEDLDRIACAIGAAITAAGAIECAQLESFTARILRRIKGLLLSSKW